MITIFIFLKLCFSENFTLIEESTLRPSETINIETIAPDNQTQTLEVTEISRNSFLIENF